VDLRTNSDYFTIQL